MGVARGDEPVAVGQAQVGLGGRLGDAGVLLEVLEVGERVLERGGEVVEAGVGGRVAEELLDGGEEVLGVGGALDREVHVVVEVGLQLARDLLVAPHLAVVHEQKAAPAGLDRVQLVEVVVRVGPGEQDDGGLRHGAPYPLGGPGPCLEPCRARRRGFAPGGGSGTVDALDLAYLVLLAATVAWAFRDAPGRLASAVREDRVLDRWTYHAVNAASVLVLAGWAVLAAVGVDAPLLGDAALGTPVRALGLAAAGAGFGLSAWARAALGSAFAPTAAVPPEGCVVDHGPYAHVRHPFYVGLLLALAGGVLALDSRATAAALATTVPLVRAIAVLEEEHIADELGEAYEAYAERVPRWVPRLG
jgi:protein-S-isoprenylcysteine O-methyltransferase Ste14